MHRQIMSRLVKDNPNPEVKIHPSKLERYWKWLATPVVKIKLRHKRKLGVVGILVTNNSLRHWQGRIDIAWTDSQGEVALRSVSGGCYSVPSFIGKFEFAIDSFCAMPFNWWMEHQDFEIVEYTESFGLKMILRRMAGIVGFE